MAEPVKTPPFLARASLPADQDYPWRLCIEASIRWTRSHAWRKPARIPLWPGGQYEVSTNDEPRNQPMRLETRPNQRLYVSLGSPPFVAVGSCSARAAHLSRAPPILCLENDLDCGASKDLKTGIRQPPLAGSPLPLPSYFRGAAAIRGLPRPKARSGWVRIATAILTMSILTGTWEGDDSDGGDRFFCSGGASGKVRAVRRPRKSPD